MDARKFYKEIEGKFSATLAREGFRSLGVTLRWMKDGRTCWTLSGELETVAGAARWLESKKLLELEEPVHFDEELAEGYAYLRSAA